MNSLTHQNLLQLLSALAASGKRLYAPVRKGQKVFFSAIGDVQQIVFDYIQTTESAKEVLFPKTERLISFEYQGKELSVTDYAETKPVEHIVFGTRPCDASAIERLAEFFKKDIPDALVANRKKALTVISVSCVKADADCFCTSTGTSPGDTTGSDILLTPIGNDQYLVEAITEKGKAIVEQHKNLFGAAPSIKKEDVLTKVEQVFSHEEITKKLSKAFNHEIWNDASLRCIGCGACAFVCPMCTCFDIQDEGTAKKGDRVRSWDSCGFSLFTLHTSGHNPRHNQSERWRQRVMHKFSYQPERLELLGCVGCGRCSRACPSDMNLKEQLVDIKKTVEAV
ncbi:MAG TPA: 4Fe-4S dicluster domain-containing protein [Bacteroidota bacterium]|nr:4Fe-4S dicluster domain-containing protein [Bacteroidota bacterium]